MSSRSSAFVVATRSLVGVVACVAWAGPAGAQFVDEAAARGVSYVVAAGGMGRGVVWADLDNDGDVDLVAVGASNGQIGIWENDGTGRFTSRAATAGLGTIIPASGASGVSAGDYDGDGDLDLYFCNGSGVVNIANRLFRNNGNWTFTNVTSAAGVGNIGSGQHASWADIDSDGDLDLYVCNYDSVISDVVYRNNADGTFSDITGPLGLVDRNLTFQSSWFDYDNDGDLDLYLSNDRGAACPTCGNYLYRNDGGVFTDVTIPAGALVRMNSMGVAVGDFDRNGFIDLYATNTIEGNKLMLNDGDGTYTQAAELTGTASYATGWGALFFDYDNNAYSDLYVCNMASVDPNRMYVHDGVWPAVDKAGLLGLADSGVSFCVAYADIDGDGDLDMVLSNYTEPLRILINHTPNQGSWAMFRVVGEGRNLWGVGARVRVSAREIVQIRDVMAGCDAFKSQNDLRVHFGLGTATTLDEVTVTWLGGPSRTLRGYPARHVWTLYPPSRLGDSTGDGLVTFADFRDLVGAYCAEPGSIVPGAEVFDFDGDADVDGADIAAFLSRYVESMHDCNADGIPDLAQIVSGELSDADADGVPDICQCPADFNGDGTVNSTDVSDFINAWFDDQVKGTLVTDWDANGVINSTDVSDFINAWFKDIAGGCA